MEVILQPMGPGSILHDLDRELDVEHARWLRKRFLWYTGLSVALSLPCVPMFAISIASVQESQRFGPIAALSGVAISTVLYALAFVSAFRTTRDRAKIAELAILLTVSTIAISLLAARIAYAYEHPLLRAQATGANTNSIANLAASMVFHVFSQLASVAITQLLACLIIPWTTRESLKSALGILLIYMTLVCLDVSNGHVKPPAIPLLGIPAAVMILTPSLICWWRYSNWRKRLSLVLENRRFRSLYQELTAARRIHESILPKPQPQHRLAFNYTYEPAREIGGDLLLVDPAPHPQGHLRMLLLDVTGHGIVAALTVNRIVGEVQRILAESPGCSPAKLLSALNHYICLTLSQHQVFASALCLELTPTSITYASAGHPTAFLISSPKSGKPTVRYLESTTFLLGCVPADDFTPDQQTLTLAPGDLLFAYTDGASEAANPAGTQLSTAGLQALVLQSLGVSTPESLPSHLQEAIGRYRATSPQDDTLLVTAWFNPTVPPAIAPSSVPPTSFRVPLNKLPT